MNQPPMPLLFPYEPAEFWGQLRLIIREEVSAMHHGNQLAL
jgi:hypothetical protein